MAKRFSLRRRLSSRVRQIRQKLSDIGSGYAFSKRGNPQHVVIHAQVRRLPSGEVQIKVPLKRGENPMAKARELAKALGRRIVSVRKGNPDSTGTFAAQAGEVGYRAILTAAPGHYLLGGVKRSVSSPFLRREDARSFAESSRDINKGSGRKVASIVIKKVNIVAHKKKRR